MADMETQFVINSAHIPKLDEALIAIQAILVSMQGLSIQETSQQLAIPSSDVVRAKAQGLEILADHGVKLPKILPAGLLNWNEYLIRHSAEILPVVQLIQSALLQEDEASIRAKYYQRDIGMLHRVLDGMSFAEAAESLGTTSATVRETVMSLTFQIANRVEKFGVDKRLLQRGSVAQMQENREYWIAAIDVFLRPDKPASSQAAA